MESPPYDIIEYLVAHGAYVEAARIAIDRGELRRAIGLYERVWRFVDALPLALSLGDRGLAVRLALDANLPARATEIADAATGEADLAAVADAFADRGRFFEAGRTRRAGAPVGRAPRCSTGAPARRSTRRARGSRGGELREAGLLYERLLAPGQRRRGRRGAPGARAAARPPRPPRGGRPPPPGRRAHRPPCGPRRLRALCAPLAGARLPRRRRRGRRPAAQGPDRRCRATPTTSSPSRTPRRLPPRRRRPAGPAQRRCGHGGGAPLRDSPPARRRRHRPRLRGRRHAARRAGRAEAAAARRRPPGDPERQAYQRFAREARQPGGCATRTSWRCSTPQPASGLFVFELMPGGTLADRLATTGALTPAAARRLALDLLAALGAAHERGIVHRDVKPANVFFDAAGNAKLGDFGGAHLADFGQTQSGGFLGTLAYMSPEQISSAPIGAAADLYALGATLFEALTGRPPFLGPDLVGQHLGEAPPRADVAARARSRRRTIDAAARAGEGAGRSLRLGERDGRRGGGLAGSRPRRRRPRRGDRRRRERPAGERRAADPGEPGRRRTGAVANVRRALSLRVMRARHASILIESARNRHGHCDRAVAQHRRRGRPARSARAAPLRRSTPRDLVRRRFAAGGALDDSVRRGETSASRRRGPRCRRTPCGPSRARPRGPSCWSRPSAPRASRGGFRDMMSAPRAWRRARPRSEVRAGRARGTCASAWHVGCSNRPARAVSFRGCCAGGRARAAPPAPAIAGAVRTRPASPAAPAPAAAATASADAAAATASGRRGAADPGYRPRRSWRAVRGTGRDRPLHLGREPAERPRRVHRRRQAGGAHDRSRQRAHATRPRSRELTTRSSSSTCCPTTRPCCARPAPASLRP